MKRITTFKQFIREQTETLSLDEMRDKVQRMCSPFLSIPGATSGFMFRGIRQADISSYSTFTDAAGNKIYWTILTRRKDRRASNLPDDMHYAADKIFKSQFGWGGRTEGVFVTGEIMDAKSYGSAHVVIPIGPTRFIWSKVINDLFNTYEDISGEYEDTGDEEFLATVRLAYTKHDLEAAIKSHNEIMLDCDTYFAIRVSDYDDDIAGALDAVKDLLR